MTEPPADEAGTPAHRPVYRPDSGYQPEPPQWERTSANEAGGPSKRADRTDGADRTGDDPQTQSNAARTTQLAPPRSSDLAEPPADEKKSELLRFFGELPVLIALALAIALLIKAFLVQPFYIEQESMVPTLHPSERVLVSKLNYRFGEPARGDVVIFQNPRDPCQRNNDLPRCNPSVPRKLFDWVVQTFGLPTSTSDDLVKRIVGLPGETIAMHDGEVYVCNTPGCHPLNPDGSPKDGLRVEFARTDTKGPHLDHDEIDQLTIPADQYYVLGDNRDGSVDSRAFGTVPRKDFVGKVVVLIWPPTRWQGL